MGMRALEPSLFPNLIRLCLFDETTNYDNGPRQAAMQQLLPSPLLSPPPTSLIHSGRLHLCRFSCCCCALCPSRRRPVGEHLDIPWQRHLQHSRPAGGLTVKLLGKLKEQCWESCTSCLCSVHPAKQPQNRQPKQQRDVNWKRCSPKATLLPAGLP